MDSVAYRRAGGIQPRIRRAALMAVVVAAMAIAALPTASLAMTTSAPMHNSRVTASNTTVTWKVLALVYRQTDVTFTRSDGSSYHLRTHMRRSMHSMVVHNLRRAKQSVYNWSGGLVRWDLTIVEVPHALGRVDSFGGASYWAGPVATARDVDQYAPKGKYDSVIVVWDSQSANGIRVPVRAWGLSIGPGWWANGGGFTSVVTPLERWWWTSSPDPQEIFVHEWMHQVLYFEQAAGRLSGLDLHAGARYGYHAVNGSWKQWLSDVMRGRVWDGNHYTGMTAQIWADGTPTS